MKGLIKKLCNSNFHPQPTVTQQRTVLMPNGWKRYVCHSCGQVTYEKNLPTNRPTQT